MLYFGSTDQFLDKVEVNLLVSMWKYEHLSYYDAAVSYPAQVQAYSSAPYVSAPPPMGYPSKDEPATVGYPPQRVPEETRSKGDGFWKGW